MPRYDLQCRFCKAKMTIYAHEEHHVDPHSIKCENCQSEDTVLMAYFFDERYRIECLKQEIEALAKRVELLETE